MVRVIERFATLEVYNSEGDDAIRRARMILRLAIGLRRQLDQLKQETGGGE